MYTARLHANTTTHTHTHTNLHNIDLVQTQNTSLTRIQATRNKNTQPSGASTDSNPSRIAIAVLEEQANEGGNDRKNKCSNNRRHTWPIPMSDTAARLFTHRTCFSASRSFAQTQQGGTLRPFRATITEDAHETNATLGQIACECAERFARLRLCVKLSVFVAVFCSLGQNDDECERTRFRARYSCLFAYVLACIPIWCVPQTSDANPRVITLF